MRMLMQVKLWVQLAFGACVLAQALSQVVYPAPERIAPQYLSERHLQPVWFGAPRLRVSESEATLRERVKRNPRDVEAHLNLAVLYAQKGDWANAARHNRRARELDSQQVNGWMGEAYALVNLKRLDEALRVMEQAQRALKDPTDQAYCAVVEGDVYLVLASERRGQRVTYLRKAEDAYRRALRKSANHPRALIGLTRLAAERNDLREMEKHLSQIYRSGAEPGRGQALAAYYRGVLLERRGDVKAARQLYNAAVQADRLSFALIDAPDPKRSK